MADLIIPAVIRWWLGFLLFFILLGYDVPFSICFSAIGGLAGGVVMGWWQAKGGIPELKRSGGSGSRADRGNARKRRLLTLPTRNAQQIRQ